MFLLKKAKGIAWLIDRCFEFWVEEEMLTPSVFGRVIILGFMAISAISNTLQLRPEETGFRNER